LKNIGGHEIPPHISKESGRLATLITLRPKEQFVAHNQEVSDQVQVYNGGFSATKALAEEVLSLTRVDRVLPEQVAVLARLHAQLDNLEAEFLTREIPFRVDGQEPFFKRGEVKALLDYLRLARNE
jgi:superfamily I DNA/RNA helicase